MGSSTMKQNVPSASNNWSKAGVLSGVEVKKRLSLEDENRLVISPILEMHEQIRDDQASVDVRLGSQFVLTQPSALGEINEFSEFHYLADNRLYQELYIPIGRNIVIHPHQFLLATTLEYIRLPQDLMCYVVGRSTWGRLGLIIATAIGVHPGFSGTLTLELRNLGETPLRLFPGQTIAQLFFHGVETDENSRQSTSQYPAAVELFPKRISSQTTKKKIGRFIEANQTDKHP